MPSTPSLTVDIIIEMVDLPDKPVILIERCYPPYGWVLPGGFVNIGETLEHAAGQEVREKISLQVKLKSLLGCYSDATRDSRGHTISAVYIAEASGEPYAADDAAKLKVVTLDNLPSDLAFDHAKILDDYRQLREADELKPLNAIVE